ncbi:hypothetical protein BZA05DRAFT_409174 [Tricharina praecox]|uniref:uncharacterized protein n=1 Tax=Tricharina praecox TaxID=43433 RepID=UPI00222067BC|nr:uncharacterized protein BZA05DRAFT_409174 [Tricharina praecox]KAI5844713.1 hypothetical protein BZA05DRAFT_409174 [Tricharina praecox]
MQAIFESTTSTSASPQSRPVEPPERAESVSTESSEFAQPWFDTTGYLPHWFQDGSLQYKLRRDRHHARQPFALHPPVQAAPSTAPATAKDLKKERRRSRKKSAAAGEPAGTDKNPQQQPAKTGTQNSTGNRFRRVKKVEVVRQYSILRKDDRFYQGFLPTDFVGWGQNGEDDPYAPGCWDSSDEEAEGSQSEHDGKKGGSSTEDEDGSLTGKFLW